MNTEEEFRNIPGVEGYMVSNQGRVLGLHGNILRPHVFQGHPRINLFKGSNKQSTRTVVDLMRAAFLPDTPKGYEPVFLDDDSSNVRLANIEWRPRHLNPRRIAALERIRGGGVSVRSKLTVADVHEIRSLAALGEKTSKIAERFNITTASCGNIIARRRWAHV